MIIKLLMNIQSSFIQVIQNGTNRTGRLSRRDFWLFYGTGYMILALLSVLISIKLYYALLAVPVEQQAMVVDSFTSMFVLSSTAGVIFHAVSLPSMVRRFQDTDRNGMACYVSLTISVVMYVYQMLIINKVSLPQGIVLMANILSLPSMGVMVYMLFIFCLKGCNQRNSFGLPSLVSSS